MKTTQQVKQEVAQAAVDWLIQQGRDDMVLGVGSGSTVACFIEALAGSSVAPAGVLAASVASEKLLGEHGISTLPAEQIVNLDIYVDGADLIDRHLRTIKGGGAALTREKLLASRAGQFVCICDASKQVDSLAREDTLERHPLPLEILPMATAAVAEEIARRGGQSQVRWGCVTDNGNLIMDVVQLPLSEPLEALEQQLASIPGVVDCGLFARRRADLLLVSSDVSSADQSAVRQVHPAP